MVNRTCLGKSPEYFIFRLNWTCISLFAFSIDISMRVHAAIMFLILLIPELNENAGLFCWCLLSTGKTKFIQIQTIVFIHFLISNIRSYHFLIKSTFLCSFQSRNDESIIQTLIGKYSNNQFIVFSAS